MKESFDTVIEDKISFFVSGFEWLEKKINKDLNMLQERNSVLERQLNRVLRSNMIKETSFKTKEKWKQKSNDDSFEDMDKNIDYRKRSEKVDTGNSIKYFDTLKNSEYQGALEKNQLQS